MENRRLPENEARLIVTKNVLQAQSTLGNVGYDTRLVGSYGRASSISDRTLSAYSGEPASLRDIDIAIVRSNKEPVSFKKIESYANAHVSDQKVDILCPNALFYDGNEAEISYRDIEISVSPDVLKPVKGNLYDSEVVTFDPMTQFHLTLLFGYVRKKDFFNLLDFGRKMRKVSHLPDDLFEPFHELSELSIKKYPGARRLREMQSIYRAVLPQTIRTTLLPVVNPIANYLRRNI